MTPRVWLEQMREIVERVIAMGFEKEPEDLVDKIQIVAEEMRLQGYFFVESRVDRVFEHLTLFFEREIGAKPKTH